MINWYRIGIVLLIFALGQVTRHVLTIPRQQTEKWIRMQENSKVQQTYNRTCKLWLKSNL